MAFAIKYKKDVLKRNILLYLLSLILILGLGGLIYHQIQIDNYKKWIRLHSFEVNKKINSLEGEIVSNEFTLMDIEMELLEAIYHEVPKDRDLEKANNLYLQGIRGYMEVVKVYNDELKYREEVTFYMPGDIETFAEEKINRALEIIND